MKIITLQTETWQNIKFIYMLWGPIPHHLLCPLSSPYFHYFSPLPCPTTPPLPLPTTTFTPITLLSPFNYHQSASITNPPLNYKCHCHSSLPPYQSPLPIVWWLPTIILPSHPPSFINWAYIQVLQPPLSITAATTTTTLLTLHYYHHLNLNMITITVLFLIYADKIVLIDNWNN